MVLLHGTKMENFINLRYHNNDLGIGAEWHFFAMSQASKACDENGGTFKKLRTKASLRNPCEEQIMIRQLYE
jgi:hypothetical protein